MNQPNQTAIQQWGLNGKQEKDGQEPAITEATSDKSSSGDEPGTVNQEPAGGGFSPDAESLRRQGFFEAITPVECPMDKLKLLLNRFEDEATWQLSEADNYYTLRIENCELEMERILEEMAVLRDKITIEEAYREADDPVLQALYSEKKQHETEVANSQKELTRIRIKLGEAKSGIIQKSLEEAELQVRTALGIQRTIYQETRALSHQKFQDERDYLKRLSLCFQELYEVYEKRYKAITERLGLLDVDGISPITTQVLTSVGVVAFTVAGFFFSTFASAAGFGNQDLLYFVLGGLMDTIRQPGSGWMKIMVLVGLILLVTAFSWLCHWWLERMRKKSRDEMFNKVMLKGFTRQKIDKLDFEISLKSNNWLGFWLQLIPVILIAGLMMLGTSRIADPNSINALNSSSEGLIAGTGIAMAVAGLIYLYIIKIVEPRLLKRYRQHPEEPVNWFRANWELVVILVLYILFALVIVLVPYMPADKTNPIIRIDYRTRYAVLLFIAITLVGAISFSYSVRSRGLVQTGRFLERALQKLNDLLAYCASPETPELHHQVAKEHGNIIEHVLRQLSFRAALPLGTVLDPPVRPVIEPAEKNIFGWIRKLIRRKRIEEEIMKDPLAALTSTNTLEERYFPHIVDELKAAEFDFNNRKVILQKVNDEICDYLAGREAQKRKLELALTDCEGSRKRKYREKEHTVDEKMERRQYIREQCRSSQAAFLDGFHLGIWYRENGMGPAPGYYQTCAQPPVKPPLLLTETAKKD